MFTAVKPLLTSLRSDLSEEREGTASPFTDVSYSNHDSSVKRSDFLFTVISAMIFKHL